MESRIAKESLAIFGIAGSLRGVASGLDKTYRVKSTDGQIFALRISSGMPIRSVSAFRIEAEWIDSLSSNDWFRVPQVQRTTTGERVGQVKDIDGVMRASTLLSWLPGRRYFCPTARHARALGQMAGALHQHAQKAFKPSASDIKSWDAKLMCLMPDNPQEGLYVVDPKAAELVQRVYLALKDTVSKLNAIDVGIINADLGLHNVLWYKGQPSLVDFNDSGIGPYAFCLARLVGRIRQQENGQMLVAELLNGYREVTPLPPAYEKQGKLFELAADVFKLNYGGGRAVRRGTPLRESELDIASTLNARLARLGL